MGQAILVAPSPTLPKVILPHLQMLPSLVTFVMNKPRSNVQFETSIK